MAKLTLLQLTQRVLGSLESDDVNNITDTQEAEWVALIIERSYKQLVDNRIIPEHYGLLTLEGQSDITNPTALKLPTGVDKIESVRYNVITSTGTDALYAFIPYEEPEQFLVKSLALKSSDTDVLAITQNGATLYIENDKAPTAWTSFDDEFMIFNSFDKLVDSTLQTSKTIIFGSTAPVWSSTDGHIPDMDESLFGVLLNDSISMAHLELKQQAHAKAEKNSRVGQSRAQGHKRRMGNVPYTDGPNFGRRNHGRRVYSND